MDFTLGVQWLAQVTTLEWSSDGSLLATGCMDGVARLWSRDGSLRHSLAAHSESIFSLRFDAMGKRLLTGSYDKCVSVWDVNTGLDQNSRWFMFEYVDFQVVFNTSLKLTRRKFLMLTGNMVFCIIAVIDSTNSFADVGGYDGRDVFASCSTDRTIAVCALSDPNVDETPNATTTPLQVLVGHADEVNAIRWDPTGKLLASCSDDHNVFVWQLGQQVTACIDSHLFPLSI